MFPHHSVPVRRAWLTGAGLVAPLLFLLPARAQTAASAQLTPPSSSSTSSDGTVQLDRVEVTGSSIKRIDGETALPVLFLDHQDIERAGVFDTEQLLKTVSAISTFGATQVANTGAGGGQGGTQSVSLLSLRGLGSARTLELINGRRSAAAGGSSAIDIEAIPVEAIDHVEILKDGASAVYGSDAVAGVVNFILRREFTGSEVSTTWGAPTRAGGGTEWRAGVFTGFGNFDTDRYNVMLDATYSYVQPIFGSNRSFARNLDVAEQLDKTSTVSFPANVRLPSGKLASPTYPNCGPYSEVSPLSPGLCRYDNAPYIALQPKSQLESVGASARFKATNTIELYFEPRFSRNRTLNTQQHVLINGAALPAGNAYITTLTNLINTQYPQFPQLKSLIGSAWALLPPTSPYYPAAFASANGLTGQPLVLLFRSVPTGARESEDLEDNSHIVAGARGTVMGWDYDTALLYSENKIATTLKQGWTLTDKYLTLVDSGVINPFGPTTDASALQAAMASNYNGLFSTTTTSIASIDGKASRDLFQLPAGMLSMAIGGEYRREKLTIDPTEPNRDFLVSGFGAPGVPTAAKRWVASGYAETNVPVVKSLEADGAVRLDDYERVGSTVNPKGSIRWQPLEGFLARGAIGSGFRAPTLLDLYQPQARGITTNGSRDLIRCPIGTTGIIDCSTQFVTIGGGNPNLQPEKSLSTTLGVLIEPVKNYSIDLEYFRIEVKDTIRTGLTAATILGDPVKYASYIQRGAPDGNPSGVGPILGINQQLTNLGKTEVDGFDVDLTARQAVYRGNKLTARLDGTYVSRYDLQNLDGSFTSAINQPAAIGIGVVLRWKHTASLTWDNGPWSATVAQNYQVGYHDLRTSLQPSTVVPRMVAPYETYDFRVAYNGFKRIELALGVKNILDRDPPYTNYGAGFVGGYDLSYTDVRGRFVYLTARYTFK